MSGAFELLAPDIQRAIFEMGWSELRPIQTEAIQVLLKTDDDLILSAPTAGGKTEAAFLPIFSRFSEDRQLLAIYVSPLKALINDQFQRLERLCEFAEIPVHRWHGDVDAQAKARFRSSPFGALLITPESLESNFVNYSSSIPRLYSRTAFVVIDELHTFIDNVRGIHLRSLLARLTATARCNPRLVGLSATLGSPDSAKSYLRPDSPNKVTLIEEKGDGRNVLIALRSYLEKPKDEAVARRDLCGSDPETASKLLTGVLGATWFEEKPLKAFEQDIPVQAAGGIAIKPDALDKIACEVGKRFRDHTNLIFTNKRATVEELMDLLQEISKQEKWPENPFVPHHGSLTKELREEAERRLKSGKPTTAVCTSTLELGIDIGDIHTVGQIDPPWTVAGLHQRLGRSGRREGEPSRLRLYTRDQTLHPDSTLPDLLFLNLVRSIAATELFLERWVEPLDGRRLHLSTMIHQLLSLLRQSGGLPADKAYEILCKIGPFRSVATSQFLDVLKGLGHKGIIEQMSTGDIIIAPAGERIVEDKSFYAAFKSNENFTIECGSSVIGELPADSVPPPGERFILDGRRWEVRHVFPERKLVDVIPTRERKVTDFMGEGGDIHTRIVKEMRKVLLDSVVPAYLDDDAQQLLAAARHAAEQSGIATSGIAVGKGLITWAPWVGTRTMRTLRSMLNCIGRHATQDGFMLKLAISNVGEFSGILEELKNQDFDPVALADKLPVKTFDRFDELLSADVLNEMNARDRLDLGGAQEAVNEAFERVCC
jgi:ATP-dependent helicase Lhr and Lhr-like helicase